MGYIDSFNFWIDTRVTSDEKTIKCAFLTAVGNEAFTLLRTLVYPKSLKAALLCVKPFCYKLLHSHLLSPRICAKSYLPRV